MSLTIKLPKIYDLLAANQAAKQAFDDSVQAFRDMLYVLFTKEGIVLPYKLNKPKDWFAMHDISDPVGKEFFLTTGEAEGNTRFMCRITEGRVVYYEVHICVKKVQGQINVPWKAFYKSGVSNCNDALEGDFPNVIYMMKNGEKPVS